jgi:hypothetical protein
VTRLCHEADHVVSLQRAPAMSVIRKKPVLGKNVSVTATPSMTQVAIHGFVASTFASREMCGASDGLARADDRTACPSRLRHKGLIKLAIA